MHKPSLDYAVLYQDFLSFFSWEWLIPPQKPFFLSQPSQALIGHFHEKHAHLISVHSKTNTLEGEHSLLNILCDQDSFKAIREETILSPTLVTAKTPSEVINLLMPYLHQKLSPQFTLHGVFLDILGKGVLIQGPSGCGKSTLANQLLAKGHRLIADDAPIFSLSPPSQWLGRAAFSLQNKLEIRGLGLIDVRVLYGATAVVTEKPLDLIINITNTDLGLRFTEPELKEQALYGLTVPCLNLPFAFQQDNVMLVENAIKVAFNSRLKT